MRRCAAWAGVSFGSSCEEAARPRFYLLALELTTRAESSSQKRAHSDAKQRQRSGLGRRHKGDVSHKIRTRVSNESCCACCRIESGNSGKELSRAGTEIACSVTS